MTMKRALIFTALGLLAVVSLLPLSSPADAAGRHRVQDHRNPGNPGARPMVQDHRGPVGWTKPKRSGGYQPPPVINRGNPVQPRPR